MALNLPEGRVGCMGSTYPGKEMEVGAKRKKQKRKVNRVPLFGQVVGHQREYDLEKYMLREGYGQKEKKTQKRCDHCQR